MTNKEAIERFSVAVTATLNEEEQDLYRTAIKALEKQIPKKPNKMWGVFCCSECGYGQDDVKKFKYCQSCGQMLGWGENK